MTTTLFDHTRLPDLSRDQWRELEDFFGEQRSTVMLHEMRNDTTLSQAQAIALLDCLALDHWIEMLVVLYHDCAETWVDAKPAGAGPFRFPIRCPLCDNELTADSVTYGLLAKVLHPELPRFVDD